MMNTQNVTQLARPGSLRNSYPTYAFQSVFDEILSDSFSPFTNFDGVE